MNISLFYFLHSFAFQYHWLDTIIWFFAEPFGYILIAFLGIYLLIKYKVFTEKHTARLLYTKGREITFVFFSGIVGWGVAEVLKSIIHFPRPFILLANVNPLFMHGGMDSFPSGHAVFFSALAISIFFKHKRIGYVYMVGALLIGLARVVAGIHFPVDILGGYLLGTIIALLVHHIIE